MQVSRVDLDARKIDLRLVNEPGIRTVLKNEARRADSEQARTQKSKTKSVSKTAAKPAKTAASKRAKSTPVAAEKSRSSRAYSKSGKKK